MAFHRVDDKRAGKTALGFLVPPGERTMVIVRPRALPWDLLPIRFDRDVGSGFSSFPREEAVELSHRLQQELEQAGGRGEKCIQIVNNPAGDGFLVWVPALDLMWTLCRRVPGRPYEPSVFATRADAQNAIERLSPFLWPDAGTDQEYYFNIRNFARSRV